MLCDCRHRMEIGSLPASRTRAEPCRVSPKCIFNLFFLITSQILPPLVPLCPSAQLPGLGFVEVPFWAHTSSLKSDGTLHQEGKRHQPLLGLHILRRHPQAQHALQHVGEAGPSALHKPHTPVMVCNCPTSYPEGNTLRFDLKLPSPQVLFRCACSHFGIVPW